MAALAEWEDRKKTLVRPSARGGQGYVDLDIVPLCDTLNSLTGVYTLQSCAGHSFEDSDGVVYPGQIWMRLDMERACRFEILAHRLAAYPSIERVSKIYWDDGKETITITFKGNDTGLLAESSETILKFFHELCR